MMMMAMRTMEMTMKVTEKYNANGGGGTLMMIWLFDDDDSDDDGNEDANDNY